MSWDEYTRAVVRIDLADGAVQVAPAQPGLSNGKFPDVLNEVVYVVTGFNAGGRISPLSVNRDANAALESRLKADRVVYLSAAGGDPDWESSEASFALIGVNEEYAKELGREFGQDAIFEWTAGEFSVLACDSARRSSVGWTMTSIPMEANPLSAAAALLGLPSQYVTLPTAKAAMRQVIQASGVDRHPSIIDAFATIEDAYWQRILRADRERETQRGADDLTSKQSQMTQRAQKKHDVSERRKVATDWGWPTRWPMRSFARWQRLGRTALEAGPWAKLGWCPADLKGIASTGLFPTPPPGEADEWRDIGADGSAALALTTLGLDFELLAVRQDATRCDDGLASWILNGEDPSARVAWANQGVTRALAQIAESAGMTPTDSGIGGVFGLVARLLLPSRNPDAFARAAAFRTFPDAWLGDGGYFEQLASALGRCGTIHSAGASIILRSGKDGIELALGDDVLQLQALDLPALPMILHCLVLMTDDTMVTSGSWSAGDLATLLCPPLEELSIDHIQWHRRGEVPAPSLAESMDEIPNEITLASTYWELVGGCDAPGGDDDGTNYLLKIGPRYVVLTTRDLTVLDEDTDESAIQSFLDGWLAEERDDLIQETWVREVVDRRHGSMGESPCT